MVRFFGTPVDVKVGQLFVDRRDLHHAFVHRPLQAGISGTRAEGADSIVLSGGYADDEDHGDYIIYTGHGGQGGSGSQIADQSLDAPGNAGLITSQIEGLPVRVTRGKSKSSPYAPPAGYQYAGLFLVTSHWTAVGQSGLTIVQFRLDRLPEQAPLITKEPAKLDPAYSTSTVSRRVRDTALSRELKIFYDHKCQVCGVSIPGDGNRLYSEGAHVRPLGRPHLGEDLRSNLLCLCPNHHIQLDIGGMVILEDWSVAVPSSHSSFGELFFKGDHHVLAENARYQRELWVTAPKQDTH
jgi:putative restriction endonuclease